VKYFIIISLVVFQLSQASPILAQNKVETGSIYTIDKDRNILPVKIITKDEIRMLNASTVMDVITYLLNFETNYIGRKGYDVRFNAWGKNNIKLLINSRPVLPDALDKFSYTQLPVYNIERIEILEGSYPVLYASNAVSVIINIILKKNTSQFLEASAGVRYSNKGNADVYGMVDFISGKHRVSVGLNRNFFGGYDRNSSERFSQWKPQRLINFSSEYNYTIIHGLEFYTSILSTNEVVKDWGVPIPHTNRVIDNDLVSRHTVLNGGLKGKLSKYHYLVFDNSYTAYSQQNTVLIKLLDQQVEERSSSAPGDSISYDQYKVMFILAREIKNKIGYEVGMEFNHQRDKNLLVQDAIKTKITNMAFMGRLSFVPSKIFSLNAGLRVNESSKYTTPLSYEASFKYDATSEFSVRANYSRSFRSPTFNELYYVFEDESLNIKGNLNLQSEVYEGFIVAMKIAPGKKVDVNASGYFQKTTNGIQFGLINPIEQIYSFVNIQNIKTLGTKFSIRYSTKTFKQVAGVNIIGLNLFPEDVAQYGFFSELVSRSIYTHPKSGFQVWIFNKYRSKKKENLLTGDTLEEIRTSSYWLTDAGFSVPIGSDKLVFSTGIKNIFNIYSVEGLHLPLVRLNDDEINRKVPVAFDYGTRYWFSIQYAI
jgi:outer membrane receptor for ferrienterochelin and colicins